MSKRKSDRSGQECVRKDIEKRRENAKRILAEVDGKQKLFATPGVMYLTPTNLK